MEFVGIERNIDDLGRIVIPKELRKQVNIVEGDTLEIFATKDGSVIMRKKSTTTIAPLATIEDDKKIFTIEDCYNDKMVGVIKISKEQDRLLDYLLENQIIDDNQFLITSGYPDCQDLTK